MGIKGRYLTQPNESRIKENEIEIAYEFGWGGREGDSTMNPSYCIRNKDNSQNLFYVTQILFGATRVEFQTSQSEVRKKMF